ncbi:MAG: hypothetical protein LBI27_00420 [Clostridiales bacterium]|jgi:hypothetical protein|nr:hypothetical protein [Clostridiales bacterium]
MKKLIVLLIAAAFFFSACGRNNSPSVAAPSEEASALQADGTYSDVLNWHDDRSVFSGLAEQKIDPEIARRINETIQSLLVTYADDYVLDSSHHLQWRIMRLDDLWLSVKIYGEVFTPSRGLPVAFALNFDMQTGELLALGDMFEAESVLASLGNGDFTQVYVASGVTDEVHLPVQLEDGYRNFRFLYFDENHNYDFYFDNDNLYLIIRAISTRHYTIYSMALADVTLFSYGEPIVTEQIMHGNFSGVSSRNSGEESDDLQLDMLNRVYERLSESQNAEWIECDLDENGLKGLILQERETGRIICIFAINGDSATLVLNTMGMQMTSVYFLSDNGNIIFAYATSGTTSYNSYRHYKFDEHGETLVYGIYVIGVEEWYIEQLKEDGIYDEMVAESPYLSEPGLYYWGFSEEHTERTSTELTEQQFLQAFEEMMGQSFYDSPMSPEWLFITHSSSPAPEPEPEPERNIFSYSEVDSVFGPGPFSVNGLTEIFGEPIRAFGVVHYTMNYHVAIILEFEGVTFHLVENWDPELSFNNEENDELVYNAPYGEFLDINNFTLSDFDREVLIKPYSTTITGNAWTLPRGIQIGDSFEQVREAYNHTHAILREAEAWIYYEYRPDIIEHLTDDEWFNAESQTGGICYHFEDDSLNEISIFWYNGYLAFD